MSKFSEMSDDELRRWIADRLGWVNLEEHSYWEETYDDTREVTDLFGDNEARRAHGDQLPNWPSSVDVALTLFGTRAFSIESYGRDSIDVTLFPDDGEREGGYRHDELVTRRVSREKIARGCSEAFAEMREKESERK